MRDRVLVLSLHGLGGQVEVTQRTPDAARGTVRLEVDRHVDLLAKRFSQRADVHCTVRFSRACAVVLKRMSAQDPYEMTTYRRRTRLCLM